MAWFQDLMQWGVDRSQGGQPHIEQFDRYYRDSALLRINELLRTQAWAEVVAIVSESPVPWFLQDRLIADGEPTPTVVFENWVARAPSALAFAMLARARTRDAWSVRGSGLASTVSPAARQQFLSMLNEAKQNALHSTELDPTSGAGWSALITIEKGLGNDMKTGHEYFLRAHAVSPFDPSACLARLNALTPRWGGTTEAMFAFAHWIQVDAPSGSAAQVALPWAHIDHALHSQPRGGSPAYLASEDVVVDINAGLGRYLDASPGWAPSPGLACLNSYIFVLSAQSMGQRELAKECLRRLDGRPTEFPWGMVAANIPEGFAAKTAWIES